MGNKIHSKLNQQPTTEHIGFLVNILARARKFLKGDALRCCKILKLRRSPMLQDSRFCRVYSATHLGLGSFPKRHTTVHEVNYTADVSSYDNFS